MDFSGAPGRTQIPALLRSEISGGGDCELLAQVQSDILPLFATRNVEARYLHCIPHQSQDVPPKLSLEVLSPASP